MVYEVVLTRISFIRLWYHSEQIPQNTLGLYHNLKDLSINLSFFLTPKLKKTEPNPCP